MFGDINSDEMFRLRVLESTDTGIDVIFRHGEPVAPGSRFVPPEPCPDPHSETFPGESGLSSVEFLVNKVLFIVSMTDWKCF